MDVDKIINLLLDETVESAPEAKVTRSGFESIRRRKAKAQESAGVNSLLKVNADGTLTYIKGEKETPSREDIKREKGNALSKSSGIQAEIISFDEEEFADSLGIEPDAVEGSLVAETEEMAEHLRVEFEVEEDNVILRIFGNGEVQQLVNAEILDEAGYEASLTPTLGEEGEVIEGDITLIITEKSSLPQTEEDTTPDSEEDNDTSDEDGGKDSNEYVDPSGLDLDEYYSTSHDIKPVENPGNRLDAEGEAILPGTESATDATSSGEVLDRIKELMLQLEKEFGELKEKIVAFPEE